MGGVLGGLVRVVGNMVGKVRGEGNHWSSKVVSAVLEAVEGRTNTLQDCQILRETNCVVTS